MTERWKAIEGFEGLYEVSNRGRVRSIKRIIVRSNGIHQTVPSKNLACRPFGKHGYVQVNLSNQSEGSKGGAVFVHVLVAKAFLKQPKGTDRVCHKDDVGSNNRVKNLYWGTASTNGKDAYKNGKHANKVMPKGNEVYNAVQDKTIRRVLRLRRKGLFLREIGAQTGLSYDTVQRICSGRDRFKEYQ